MVIRFSLRSIRSPKVFGLPILRVQAFLEGSLSCYILPCTNPVAVIAASENKESFITSVIATTP
jgi:hypothetical protein